MIRARSAHAESAKFAVARGYRRRRKRRGRCPASVRYFRWRRAKPTTNNNRRLRTVATSRSAHPNERRCRRIDPVNITRDPVKRLLNAASHVQTRRLVFRVRCLSLSVSLLRYALLVCIVKPRPSYRPIHEPRLLYIISSLLPVNPPPTHTRLVARRNG